MRILNYILLVECFIWVPINLLWKHKTSSFRGFRSRGKFIRVTISSSSLSMYVQLHVSLCVPGDLLFNITVGFYNLLFLDLMKASSRWRFVYVITSLSLPLFVIVCWTPCVSLCVPGDWLFNNTVGFYKLPFLDSTPTFLLCTLIKVKF